MKTPPLYPLQFEPIFKNAIWGGRRLASLFPDAPPEGSIGEAWLLSDQGDNVSVVAEGPLQGMTLRDLMRDRREELLGSSLARHEAFPLLLKIIDARESLSVQVHPDDEFARTFEGVPRGKTEAWIVLHAEPGSRIYAGLKSGIDGARLERAIADGTVEKVLYSFSPRPFGDCLFLPAGTVHALGGGVTVFEVQQTSDTTYRLFDWNRVDAATGKPRQLHIKQALACANYNTGPAVPVKPTVVGGPGHTVQSVESIYFTIRHTTLDSATSFAPFDDCRVVVPLSGGGVLRHARGQTTLSLFRPILVPPGVPTEIQPDGQVVVVVVQPL
jgi:mannose-6-phosphate isomerase